MCVSDFGLTLEVMASHVRVVIVAFQTHSTAPEILVLVNIIGELSLSLYVQTAHVCSSLPFWGTVRQQ